MSARRAALTMLLLGIAVHAASAESTVGDAPMPSLGPTVELQPLLPRPSTETASPDERVLRGLESLVQQLDRDIADIMSRYQGMRPATRVQQFPELETARRKRDASWDELQNALQSDDILRKDRDPLDVPGTKRGQDEEERRLLAQNLLAQATCLYELGTGLEIDAQALEEGRVILATIPYQDLPIADKPFVHYYRFAFTLQQARQLAGTARENLMREARRHRDLLRREFPDSYLTSTADSLLANGDFDVSSLEQVEPATVAPTTVPQP